MIKSEIRKEIKNLQKVFLSDPKNRIQASYKICQLVTSSEEFHKASIIFAFMPMNDEVNIGSIITEAFLLNKKVAVPLITDTNGSMEFHWIDANTQMKPGAFGIFEPPVNLVSLDLIKSEALLLVPGLAFSSDGKRLGRGKGFYDRFISENENRFHKIGICFDFQIRDDLPVDENDMPVEKIFSA